MDDEKDKHITFNQYKENFDIWVKTHNIVREKSELYCDFLLGLIDVIDETYLGSDILIMEIDILNHFTWCFNKILSNFEKEKIYFTNKNEFFDYLWVFFYKAYYTCITENKVEIITEYFKLLFNFNRLKTQTELESFSDLYKLFEENLKKIN